MNKQTILLWMIAVILPLSSFAQGVDFREVTMREALDAAAKEKKLVFVDFYTTWCGPCKKMSAEVFTQVQVGEFFNKVFVNLKLDAEKGEGKTAARKYKISAYPTFLVLNPEGMEVYRTVGAMEADAFVEKVRKGIDPKWSPEGITRRYEKGERTSELVNDYAMLMMERKKYEEGERVIADYFEKLSDKKRVKPENFFLYSRYALNAADPKADYMFANKERFVKANGQEQVEKLLYNWLRQQIMPFISVRVISDTVVNEEKWQRLKEKIQRAALANEEGLMNLGEIAEVRLKGDLKEYLKVCREKFPFLEARDRFAILINFGALKEQDEEVRQVAVDLLKANQDVVDGVSQRVFYMTMLDLEGKKEFRLRAAIDAVKSGKVVVSYSLKGKLVQEEYEFDNHVLDISIAGRDTLSAGIRFLCDELATPTVRGNNQYPHLSFMIVPGEFAVMKLDLEKGKVPVVKWDRGGTVSHDFMRLNYDLLTPEEKVYNQLMVDNVIQGGDIRNYSEEFQASWEANKRKIMEFVRNNTSSYISAVELTEHYIWFDENETESIYQRFPSYIQNNPYGQLLKRRLDNGREFRTGTKANNFVKKDMNGKSVSLDRLKGKYVLLDFWGSWCGPCRESHPYLKELYAKYKKQVAFINVAQENVRDLAEARKLWKNAVKEDGMNWTQILNNEGREECDMIRLFGISSFPTKVLIDPNGVVVARMIGAMVDVDEVLEKILSSQSGN